MHHARDREVFQRDPVVALHQIVRQISAAYALLVVVLAHEIRRHDFFDLERHLLPKHSAIGVADFYQQPIQRVDDLLAVVGERSRIVVLPHQGCRGGSQ